MLCVAQTMSSRNIEDILQAPEGGLVTRTPCRKTVKEPLLNRRQTVHRNGSIFDRAEVVTITTTLKSMLV